MKRIAMFLLLLLSLYSKAQITIDSIWVSSNPICIDGNGTAIVYVSPPGNYSFLWTFDGLVDDPTNDSTGFTPTNSGIQTLTVEVSDGIGNSATDFVSINVHDFENFSAYPPTATVHCGESVQLNTNISSSGQTTIEIGNITGANSPYNYPAPFGNWYANEKQQFLFLASELNAMGIPPGNILGLNFPITQVGGLLTYPNYSVKMGHTTATNLTTTFLPVDPTILFTQNFTVQTGNNNLIFSVPFTWNGIDNVVIEICYVWVAQYNYTTNAISPYTTTTFNSSSLYNSDGTVACPNTVGFSTSFNRPLTGFIVGPPTNLGPITYLWTPNSTLSADNISNPIATTTTDTWYFVTATDSVCWVQDSVQVIIDSSYTFNLTQFPFQVCQGTTVTPNVQTQWMNSWIWTIENNGTTTATGSSVSIPYNTVGEFDLMITGITACGETVVIIDSINVISNQPVIVLNIPNDTLCVNQTFSINAVGSYGNISWEYDINSVPQTQLGYYLSYTNSSAQVDTITVSATFCSSTIDSTLLLYTVNCLSTDEVQSENIEIFIAENTVHIQDHTDRSKNIFLFNTEGKLIQTWRSSEREMQLQIDYLPSGIYFMEVITSESQARKKFVRY